MKHDLTLAHINLNAVMRNLEDLCHLDDEMRGLIKDRNLSLQIRVKNGPSGAFKFENGSCTYHKGRHPSNVVLYFTSPSHFNRMVDGQANPIPLKGLSKLKFLTNEFTALTDRLEYYLKPTPALLEDPEYFRINTTLTAYTAFFALAEIGNTDPLGQMNSARIPNGNIAISIHEGPSIHLKALNGNLEAVKGMPEKVRASMTFSDMTSAGNLLNGKTDSYTCIAQSKLKLKGYVPMLDNMNKLLGQVTRYL